MLQIAYNANDYVFEGLYLSILSILRRTKQTITFYVLTGDLSHLNPDYKSLSKKHIEILDKLITDFNKDNKLVVLDCSQLYIEKFGYSYDVMYFTPYALFRLLLDQFEQIKGLVLYLDVDTLTNNDIVQCWDVNMNEAELCVCRDYHLTRTKDSVLPIFNTGVMLINIDYVRQTNYFDKARKFIVKNKPIMIDQQALYFTWSKIRVWKDEGKYNYQKLGIEPDTVVKHFCITEPNALNGEVIKPWRIHDVQTLLNLHNWDEDYKYFLEQKKTW